MMDDRRECLACQWKPWWAAPAAHLFGLAAIVAMAGGFAAALGLVFGLLEIAAYEGWLAALPTLIICLAYALCFRLYPAKQSRPVIAGVAVILCAVAIGLGGLLGQWSWSVYCPLIALLSHAALLVAVESARASMRLVDSRHWRHHRLMRGLCPLCGYDIRCLPGRRCPECGMTWSAEEAAGEHEPTRSACLP
jgi:hypothetical protein